MKKILLMALPLILFSIPAFGQGGLIGLYTDIWGSQCDFEDRSYDILEVKVVHKFSPGMSGSQFKVQASPGFTGVYLGEEFSPQLTALFIGNTQTGIGIAYGACYSDNLHVITIRYIIYGTSEPLSYLEVVTHLGGAPPGLWATSCDHIPQLLPAQGGRAYITNDGSAYCTITPNRNTTWGGIKALYAE